MKSLFIVLVTTLFLQAGDHITEFAKEYQYETSYKTALAKAKKQNKELMLVMVTHYCPWCRKFEQKALSNKTIDKRISKKFVKLILNREKHNFPEKFDTPRIPTTYFIKVKDESIILTHIGYKNADFTKVLNKIPAR